MSAAASLSLSPSPSLPRSPSQRTRQRSPELLVHVPPGLRQVHPLHPAPALPRAVLIPAARHPPPPPLPVTPPPAPVRPEPARQRRPPGEGAVRGVWAGVRGVRCGGEGGVDGAAEVRTEALEVPRLQVHRPVLRRGDETGDETLCARGCEALRVPVFRYTVPYCRASIIYIYIYKRRQGPGGKGG
jgi:hypothetical protein